MCKKPLLLMAILLFILAGPGSVLAQSDNAPAHKRVIIFMIDKLNLSDLEPETTPSLWEMQNRAGAGLLNTLSAGERTGKNIVSTISAGKLAVGSNEAQLNFKASEPVDSEKAGDVFFRDTGVLPADDNVVVSSIEIIKRNNEKRNLGQPGKLGDQLHALNLRTAVIGNSDMPGYYSRLGALTLMDSSGIVDNGFIGKNMTSTTGRFPSSNYENILTAFRELKSYDVVLVEFGDLARLNSHRSLFSDEQLQAERKQRLLLIDACIADLQNEIGPADTVYVISPTSSSDAVQRGEVLTPLIIAQPGATGLLTSYSTRQDGIVSTTNLKNSILHNFNPQIADTIYSVPAADALDILNHINQRVVFEYSNQVFLITIHIIFMLLLIILALLARYRYKHTAAAEFLLLTAVAIPLSLFLIANFAILNRWLFLLVSLLLTVLLSLICLLAARLLKTGAFNILLFLTIAAVALDLVFDFGLLKQSILSYRITSGSRYYGLGNEYMGVLIGSTIALAALLLQRSYSARRLGLVAILFSLVIFLIAYPLFGINVGGSITACIGLGFTYLRFRRYDINIARISALLLGTVALVAVIAVIDLKQPLEIQSHLGRSISLIQGGGLGEMFDIIARKIQMQFRIINYSVWGWVLLFLILASSYFIFRPISFLQENQNRAPLIYSGLQGIIVAAVIAIIFNDSGITAAAVLSLYFIALYIKFMLR